MNQTLLHNKESLSEVVTSCNHQWRTRDSMFNNEDFEDVYCVICGVSGERTIETGEVYWPAT